MECLLYVFHGIWHFVASNSRHGTHSPFVYRLADEVVYNAQKKQYAHGRKYDRLLNEIADYFAVGYTLSPQDTGEGKALCLQNSAATVEDIEVWQRQFHYIVLEGVYRDGDNRRRWQAICQDRRFVVTVDLFFFGLVFYRTEQPKQNFRLRFPFWKYL